MCIIVVMKNQKGFGVVEGLLVLIIIGLIGSVGWYVFSANKVVDKVQTINMTIKSGSEPQVSADKTTTISIKELGVSFSGPKSLDDVNYAVRNDTRQDGTNMLGAMLSSKSLANFDAACSASNAIYPPLGMIVKVDGQYPTPDSGVSDAGVLVKQFPTYYIATNFFGEKFKPHTTCSDKDMPEALDKATTALRNDLEKSIGSIKELQLVDTTIMTFPPESRNHSHLVTQ